MKRYGLLSLLALLVFSVLVSAQPLRGSYFFENSLLRSKLNPAFAPQTHYVSVPVAGYASADILSNVGLSNFLFPVDDKTYTFLNDAVDASTFLDKLPADDPYFTAKVQTDLLGGGYRLNDRIYLTASLSVTGRGNADVSRALLEFAKKGRSGSIHSRSLPGLKAHLMSYATLSAGCSYDMEDLVPGLRVGGRLNLMTGLVSANATLHALDIRLDDDIVSATTRGNIGLAGFAYDPEGGFRSEKLKLRGFGASVDLGAEYRLRFDGFVNGLNLSASVGNLGRLSFGSANMLSADGSASFEGFNQIGDENFDLPAALDKVIEDFSSLTILTPVGATPLDYILDAEIYAGAEVPFLNDMLSAGILYSRYLSKSHFTLSFNASPLEWLNLNASYTFGPTNRMGFYAEYIPKKYVGFFFGFEKSSFKTNRNLLGVKNFTESLCLGLNILL